MNQVCKKFLDLKGCSHSRIPFELGQLIALLEIYTGYEIPKEDLRSLVGEVQGSWSNDETVALKKIKNFLLRHGIPEEMFADLPVST